MCPAGVMPPGLFQVSRVPGFRPSCEQTDEATEDCASVNDPCVDPGGNPSMFDGFKRWANGGIDLAMKASKLASFWVQSAVAQSFIAGEM